MFKYFQYYFHFIVSVIIFDIPIYAGNTVLYYDAGDLLKSQAMEWNLFPNCQDGN